MYNICLYIRVCMYTRMYARTYIHAYRMDPRGGQPRAHGRASWVVWTLPVANAHTRRPQISAQIAKLRANRKYTRMYAYTYTYMYANIYAQSHAHIYA